ncbi:MAG: hypothetical protein U0Q16_10140 [Bryobacteraceae bacterium]
MNRRRTFWAALSLTLGLATGAAQAQSWIQISTGIQQIAAAADGTLWGYTYTGQIVKGAITGAPNTSGRKVTWAVMPPIPLGGSGGTNLPSTGSPVRLSVGGANQVLAIDTVRGVAYRWTGSAWQAAQGQNPGPISSVSAASDGTMTAIASGRPIQLTPCTAPSAAFDDWSWLPHNFYYLSDPTTQTPPDLRAVAGPASNPWAITTSVPAQLLYWNSLNASLITNPRSSRSWWELAPPPPGAIRDLGVGSDGSVFAATADSRLWKAAITTPCAPGSAGCLQTAGLRVNSVTWTPLANQPPAALLQIAVLDQNRLLGVAPNGDVYANYPI